MARKRFKRDIQTATIDKLSHDGRGICQQDGKTTFVMGALPGESVSYRPMRSQKGIIEAVVTEVHEPANDRENAICQHFTQCGGCQLQHISSDTQIEHKYQAFKELLQHIGAQTAREWCPAITGPTKHYRRRARLSVRYVAKKEKVLVGFREVDGRFVSDNSMCPIMAQPFDSILPQLSDCLMQLSNRDKVPQIEITRTEDDAICVIRHLSEFTPDDICVLFVYRC